MFHNPPSWSNKNSNIESLNATIKRDFSLRKRYSVWGSIDIIEEIIDMTLFDLQEGVLGNSEQSHFYEFSLPFF